MRELLECVAMTAAWMEFCFANRLVDTVEMRNRFTGRLALQGPAWLIARSLAMTMQLAAVNQWRREQPRVIPFNGRA